LIDTAKTWAILESFEFVVRGWAFELRRMRGIARGKG